MPRTLNARRCARIEPTQQKSCQLEPRTCTYMHIYTHAHEHILVAGGEAGRQVGGHGQASWEWQAGRQTSMRADIKDMRANIKDATDRRRRCAQTSMTCVWTSRTIDIMICKRAHKATEEHDEEEAEDDTRVFPLDPAWQKTSRTPRSLTLHACMR